MNILLSLPTIFHGDLPFKFVVRIWQKTVKMEIKSWTIKFEKGKDSTFQKNAWENVSFTPFLDLLWSTGGRLRPGTDRARGHHEARVTFEGVIWTFQPRRQNGVADTNRNSFSKVSPLLFVPMLCLPDTVYSLPQSCAWCQHVERRVKGGENSQGWICNSQKSSTHSEFNQTKLAVNPAFESSLRTLRSHGKLAGLWILQCNKTTTSRSLWGWKWTQR